MSFFESMQAPATVFAVVLVPMLAVGTTLILWKRYVRNRKRRSPLTTELLRSPGFGLQRRIEDLNDDITLDFAAATWAPLMLFGTYQLDTQTAQSLSRGTLQFIYASSAVVILALMTIRLIRNAGTRQKFREALDGELATAQLLEPIIAGGGRVLHDIQGPTFNIDHVVVAPGGVFAVETKHRLKSTQGKAKEQAKVICDGQALRFPDWTETQPLEQARAQASWLSERLTRSTGVVVNARPVVALPGWYVERTKPGGVLVINPKNCKFMLKPRDGEPLLAPDLIARIGFQVEQLCAMPEPEHASGRVGKPWKDRRGA